jgi:hypothetical protein
MISHPRRCPLLQVDVRRKAAQQPDNEQQVISSLQELIRDAADDPEVVRRTNTPTPGKHKLLMSITRDAAAAAVAAAGCF